MFREIVLGVSVQSSDAYVIWPPGVRSDFGTAWRNAVSLEAIVCLTKPDLNCARLLADPGRNKIMTTSVWRQAQFQRHRVRGLSALVLGELRPQLLRYVSCFILARCNRALLLPNPRTPAAATLSSLARIAGLRLWSTRLPLA